MVLMHKEDMHEAQGKNGNICLNTELFIFNKTVQEVTLQNDSLLCWTVFYVAENKQGIVAFPFARSDPNRLLLMGYGYDM
jgi:hypothetical protein